MAAAREGDKVTRLVIIGEVSFPQVTLTPTAPRLATVFVPTMKKRMIGFLKVAGSVSAAISGLGVIPFLCKLR